MNNSSKRVIILFGPPGAGKGTQATLLAEKLGLYSFETSKILEKEFKEANEDSSERYIEFEGQKFDVLNEKKIWEEGILCTPAFVAYLVTKEIKKLFDDGKSLVLSASPRTLYEAEKIIPLLKELYGEDIKAFWIEIEPEETMARNSNRRICELMRHSILHNSETEKLSICPIDGSKLVRREGLDDPETIKVRLKEYKERTFPIFQYLENNGIKVEKVKGRQSVADVYEEIMGKLK